MPGFLKRSTLWITDWRYDGHPRRLWQVLPDDPMQPWAAEAVARRAAAELADLHGTRAQVASARPASPDEERDYLRGEVAPPVMCPTGRADEAARAKRREPGPDRRHR